MSRTSVDGRTSSKELFVGEQKPIRLRRGSPLVTRGHVPSHLHIAALGSLAAWSPSFSGAIRHGGCRRECRRARRKYRTGPAVFSRTQKPQIFITRTFAVESGSRRGRPTSSKLHAGLLVAQTQSLTGSKRFRK